MAKQAPPNRTVIPFYLITRIAEVLLPTFPRGAQKGEEETPPSIEK